jgi:FemAB-related protein (PEP-CTERM system-associated)
VTDRSIKVRRACDADAATWDRFVESCSGANFYMLYDWIRINRDVLGHPSMALIAEEGDRVVGVLPMSRVTSPLFGDIVASMPFVNLGGVAASDEEAQQALVSAARREADGTGCDYLELRGADPLEGFRSLSHKVSMTIELPSDPEELWTAFSSKHRTNVRRAYKNDFEIRSGGAELLGAFYGVMESGWRALGTPLYAREYFRAIMRAFGKNAEIFVAYREGTPVATALNGGFGGVVEGMWAAVHPAFHDLQPNYFLYWEMIRSACRDGFHRYHLGRSTKGSGAQRFKARWEASPTPLHWNYHLVRATSTPELNPDNPRFQLAIRAWRGLPLPVTRVVGPALARFIP